MRTTRKPARAKPKFSRLFPFFSNPRNKLLIQLALPMHIHRRMSTLWSSPPPPARQRCPTRPKRPPRTMNHLVNQNRTIVHRLEPKPINEITLGRQSQSQEFTPLCPTLHRRPTLRSPTTEHLQFIFIEEIASTATPTKQTLKP